MSAVALREIIPLTEAVINPDNKTVDVVLIRPGWSQNGRYYSREVLAQAAALFEGVKAYANHPTPDALRRGEGRSVLDITGDYTGIHVGATGELRATRNVFGAAGETIWPLIVRGIESQRPVIGLSINAIGIAKQGKAPDGREGIIVEAFKVAHSVDDVTEPAAGGGFERLIASADTLTQDLIAAMTYDEFCAARPDFIEKIREQQKRVRQDEAVRTALEERDQAQAALVEAQARIAELEQQVTTHRAEAEQERRTAALELALAETKLPADWQNDLRTRLTELDPAEWVAIIQTEKRKARQITEQRPVAVQGAPALMPLPETVTPSLVPGPNEDVGAWMARTQRR